MATLIRKEYQMTGIKTLVKNKKYILGDDMGLGKTIQIASAISFTRKTGTKAIIVAPVGVHHVWANEFTKWGLPDRVRILEGSWADKIMGIADAKNYDAFIVSHESLKDLVEALKTLSISYIVVDEAHKLKNPKANRRIAVKELMDHFPFAHYYLATGTPLMNKPEELWSLIDLLDPLHTLPYQQWVKTWYKLEWVRTATGGVTQKYTRPIDVERFKEYLSKFMLRRMKKDVLKDLPPRTYIPYECELVGEQKRIYEEAAQYMMIQLQFLEEQHQLTIMNMLSQLLRLKQILISPSIWKDSLLTDTEPWGCKVTALNEIIEDSGDQKIVVFCEFQEAIKQYCTYFKRLGYNCARIDGTLSTSERKIAEFEFQEGDCKILFVSTGAGGVGLTLTAGSICVLLNLMWNPALNVQAMDRLYRHGQVNPVTVYELYVKNTVEDRVRALLQDKIELIMNSLPTHNLDGSMMEALDVPEDEIMSILMANWRDLVN